MTAIVGGLRARLIKDSIYHCLRDSLTALGWFDVGRQHSPINFTANVTPNDTEIPLNTLALADESLSSNDLELGSNAVQTHWLYYVDFYAENDVIGTHLINDVRDVLGGRMSSIGRIDASVVVYDYQQATPPRIFTVGIEDLFIDRAHDFPKTYQKHWYACRFHVVDAYSDDLSDISYDGGGVNGDTTDSVDGGSP